jgi:hypothetical protein
VVKLNALTWGDYSRSGSEGGLNSVLRAADCRERAFDTCGAKLTSASLSTTPNITSYVVGV